MAKKKPIDKINISVKNGVGKGKGSVKMNGSTANILLDIPKAKAPEAAATGVTTAVVTETISYEINDDIDEYTLDMNGTEITIDGVIGFDGLDIRDFIPWYDVDDEIPVISLTVSEVTNWYFLAPLVYIGTEDSASLRWLESQWRAAAVYK